MLNEIVAFFQRFGNDCLQNNTGVKQKAQIKINSGCKIFVLFDSFNLTAHAVQSLVNLFVTPID